MKAISFAGLTTALFTLAATTVRAEAPTAVKSPSHHVVVVDCSGSMYYDLPKIRETLDQVVAVEDFLDSGVSYTLISYASSGDVKIHATRAAAGDKGLRSAIQSMGTRGCTCISQGLRKAIESVVAGEVTAITLHTDGYANDPGFESERKSLTALVKSLPAGSFLNTIAYGGYSDFSLLDSLASQGGGVCVRAADAKAVFNSIRDTTALLAAQTVPTKDFTGNGLVIVTGNGKFATGNQTVSVRGIRPDAVYDVYDFVAGTEGGDAPTGKAVASLARHFLREGQLVLAKEIVNGFSGDFARRHYRALTGEQVAAFAVDLDDVISGSLPMEPSAPLVITGTTVLDILSAMNDSAVRVDVAALAAGYRSRSVRKLQGYYDDAGNFVPNAYKLVGNTSDFVPVSDIKFSSDAATVNMQIRVDASLVEVATGNVVTEVAGIPLNLSKFNNYTIIGCGDLNVRELVVKISKATAFQRLLSLGAVSGAFDPTATYTINLEAFPVVAFGQKATLSVGTINSLFRLTVLNSFLSAFSKESGSVDYTPEQVSALREHCLTPALYFSGKTTVPYRDREEALAAGEIDEIPEYSVSIGTPEITETGKLHSANKFLERFYAVAGVDKLNAAAILANPTATVTRKVLGARVKVTAVDTFMAEIYDSLLGLTATAIPELPAATLNTIRSRVFSPVALAEGKAAVAEALESIWSTIRPVVFYIGATGSIPDFDGGSVTLDAEAFEKAYPEAALSKAEKSGTFVVVGGSVVLAVTESARVVPGRTLPANTEAE